MYKKGLIALVVIVLLAVLGFFCSNVEQKEQSQWTQSSQGLLQMKKYPKKPLGRKNLFD
ncbi:MAG: hypothetical protein AB7V50_00470 [Vampirovibrionia bacterium]